MTGALDRGKAYRAWFATYFPSRWRSRPSAVVAPRGSRRPPAFDAGQGTLRLSAALAGSAAPLTGGLRWRVFAARADPDGSHPLVVESSDAQPTLTVPPGDYVVHVALGLASAAKRVSLAQEVRASG